MPSPESSVSTVRSKTWAWVTLIGLTLVSVQAAHTFHSPGWRLLASAIVAVVAWTKGMIVIQSYLESRLAGPIFHRLVLGFAALAPCALIVSGVREFLRGG